MRRAGLQATRLVGLLVLCFSEPAYAQIQALDPAISAVETGGYWEDGGRNGTIRLVVVTGGQDHLVSTLHAQWIADANVVRSVAVSATPPGVWVFESPRFELVDKRWQATIEGTNTHTSPSERRRWVLMFGGPGEVNARPLPPTSSGKVSAAGQTVAGTEDLYLTALRAAADEMARVYGRFGGDYRNLLVEKDLITEGFPATFGTLRLAVLDALQLCQQFKKVGTLSVLGVRPMRIVEDRLKVNVPVYKFSCKTPRFWFGKDRFMFGLSDGAEVSFRLDLDRTRFVVESVSLGGV